MFRISRVANNRKDIKISWLFQFNQIIIYFFGLIAKRSLLGILKSVPIYCKHKHSLLNKYSYKISNGKENEEYYIKQLRGNIFK